MGLLAELTDGGMEEGLGYGCPGLLEQGSERHGGEPTIGLQHLSHPAEFGLFHRADHQPARDDKAGEDGGEGAQGDFPPDAEVHAGKSDSRSLYPSDLIEMMASFNSGSFCLSRRTWTSTVRVVP